MTKAWRNDQEAVQAQSPNCFTPCKASNKLSPRLVNRSICSAAYFACSSAKAEGESPPLRFIAKISSEHKNLIVRTPEVHLGDNFLRYLGFRIGEGWIQRECRRWPRHIWRVKLRHGGTLCGSVAVIGCCRSSESIGRR